MQKAVWTVRSVLYWGTQSLLNEEHLCCRYGDPPLPACEQSMSVFDVPSLNASYESFVHA